MHLQTIQMLNGDLARANDKVAELCKEQQIGKRTLEVLTTFVKNNKVTHCGHKPIDRKNDQECGWKEQVAHVVESCKRRKSA